VSDGLDKEEILRAVRAERARTAAFLRTIEPAQWETVALPGWRIREVVAHLISLDVSAVNGTILPVALASMDKLERWNDRQVGKRANRRTAELLVALERWGPRFVALARVIPRRLYQVRMPTIWGKGPGGLLIWSRAYDEWVHRQDMRRALALPDEDADLASVGSFLMHAGAAVLFSDTGRASGRVELQLTGVPIPRYVFDWSKGRLAAGDDGPEADTLIRAERPAAFIMSAAGREPSFAELQDRGEVVAEGDDALGKEFLSQFRVV
jgi:uncharacterized protein (TIGR03083 family)